MAISRYLAEAGATPMLKDPSSGRVISTGSSDRNQHWLQWKEKEGERGKTPDVPFEPACIV